MTPEKTIGRLSLYVRILEELAMGGRSSVYSHELADKAGVTSSQVRRDIMFVGYSGRSNAGYDVEGLLGGIEEFLNAPDPDGVALVGIGNLGRAILAFFRGRRPKLALKAGFDSDPGKVNRVIHGCRCYPVEQLEEVLPRENIKVGVIAVPEEDAQSVADRLIRAGVRGIVNFAPIPLNVKGGVYVEDIDLTMSLEKVAHFARKNAVEIGDNK